MASNAHNVAYNPVPLAHDDHAHPGSFYPHASVDDLQNSGYNTPHNELDIQPLTSGMPAGAAQPRFMGAAMYQDASLRESVASSHYTNNGSEYGNSVYALDPSGGYRDDPNAPYEHGAIPMSPIPKETGRFLADKNTAYAAPRAQSKRRMLIYSVIAGIVVLIIAIGLAVYFLVVKPRGSNNRSSSSSSSTTSTAASPTASSSTPNKSKTLITGGDGSKVTMDNGTTFTYTNKFGGSWYYDPQDPFNNGAKAQSWSPALNETFNYGVDPIRG